jgi:hypothetical protein
MKFARILVLLFPLCAALAVLADDKPAEKPIVIVDSNGKEQKLKSYTFVVGTRHLGFLAPAEAPKDVPEEKKPGDKPETKPTKPTKPGKATTGPEALEFRDEDSTTFVEGILTLVPLEYLRSVSFDDEKQTATIKVATDVADGSETYTGSTKFKGINKFTIEAEVDKGDLGIAEVKFLGGVTKGMREMRFPTPKAAPDVKGRPASVTVADKGKKVQKVVDLQPLYRSADGERLAPTLFFKKTLKIDVAKVKKLTSPGEGGNGEEWTVAMKDGQEETLTLLKMVTLDGKDAQFVGFVGKIRGGYKLFPAHAVAEVQFDETKGEEKP